MESPLRNSTVGLTALTDLVAETSLCCPQLAEAEADYFFQSFVSCFSSWLPPRTPPYTCLGSLQSPPNGFTKGLQEISWWCSLFLPFWEKGMTEIWASLNLGNFLMEMTAVSLKSLRAWLSLHTQKHTGILLYLSVALRAVWPQYGAAAIRGSAGRKWNLERPGLIDGLPDTGFSCFRAL